MKQEEEKRKDPNLSYNEYEKRIIELDIKKKKLEKVERELKKLEKEMGLDKPKAKLTDKKKKSLSCFLIITGIITILWTALIFSPENVPLGFAIFVSIMVLIFGGAYLMRVNNEVY